jgi:hypothetical protein
MQPIKTTNAINPAPAKGIESFPTPVIDDVVISEIVNSWKGDYQPLEYGTLWKDVSHAPNQGSFPEHKLVYQQPTSEDGQWIKRIWVNDRVNQDSYNYAIKYSAGSQDHPIYIRTYVVPREGYAPLPDGTPDPLFPTAVLVDEEATRIEGELDSKYITVTRVYETLPGPQVPTKRYNERGDLETVLVQTVPPFTPPDPDGLLVTSSQVVQEEMGKGIKTTSTVQDHSLLQIKEKKEGLLGETITTDDIVSPSTNPDALSQTIIASTVEQFSATKARKRTTTSTGPSSLVTTSLVDSAVGQVSATVSKSIVPIGDTPTGGKSVLQDQITAIDSVKAQRETVTVSTYPELTTYDLDEALGVSIITEREVVDHNTPYSTPPLVLTLNDRPLDQWKTLRITSRLSGLPPQRIEYATKQFTFPAVLLNQSSPSSLPVNVTQQNVGFGRVATSVEGVTQWVASGANKFISITPNQLRPAVSLPTRFKTLVTFIDASTNPSGIIPVSPNDDVYKISPQSVSYSGSLFSFNFGEVLTNGFTISVTASQYDERYKGLSETITIAPSSPTASQYWLTDRSSEKLISWDVEYWRSNIWILRKTYITLI